MSNKRSNCQKLGLFALTAISGPEGIERLTEAATGSSFTPDPPFLVQDTERRVSRGDREFGSFRDLIERGGFMPEGCHDARHSRLFFGGGFVLHQI